jgi:hypothetical protein
VHRFQQEPDLWTDAEDARFERAHPTAPNRIRHHLLVDAATVAISICLVMNCDTAQSRCQSMPFWYWVEGLM